MKAIAMVLTWALILLAGCATSKPPQARYVPGQPVRVVKWQDYEPGMKIRLAEYGKATGISLDGYGRNCKFSKDEVAQARRFLAKHRSEDLIWEGTAYDTATPAETEGELQMMQIQNRIGDLENQMDELR